MKGHFQEKVPGNKGNFIMTISSVGRNSIVKNFSVKLGEKSVDFGTMYITDASNELGQVEIVAQKPLVKADIDKIEYNVQDDPDSKSNSVLEMLRKVPLVTVDGEDNIKVNGSSSFKVYVNGKPNNMMSNNPTEVLKSMPANSIKHIEVITNPSAKYDAEGVGGILNIVTVGGGLEGYTATFSGNVSNRGAGGGVFGTIKSGKLTSAPVIITTITTSPAATPAAIGVPSVKRTAVRPTWITAGQARETVLSSQAVWKPAMKSTHCAGNHVFRALGRQEQERRGDQYAGHLPRYCQTKLYNYVSNSHSKKFLVFH